MSEWNSNLILPGGAGNPRQQVADIARRQAEQKRNPESLTHGMTTHQIVDLNKRFDSMMPRLATADPNSGRRDLFSEALPTGASWDPRTGGRRQAGGFMTGGGGSGLGSSSGGGSNISTMQRPYQPEFESPDRQQYPVHRILANRYWRLFIKLDPVLGTGLDMYGEMPWGECRLTGEGVEGSVREAYEAMWEGCNISSLLPAMVKEFLGIGEVVPHCFPGNQQVLTPTGYVRIDALQIGDSVISHTGNRRLVTEVHTRAYDGLGYHLNVGKIGGEVPVTCTKEHPFLVWSREDLNGVTEWKRANKLQVGDYVALQVDRSVEDVETIDMSWVAGFSESVARSEMICPRRKGVMPTCINVDEDLLRLIGYFFSEGFVTQDGLRFTFHTEESAYHTDVQQILKSKFGLDARVDLDVNGTKTATVNVNSAPLRLLFLTLFGTGAAEKRVPLWMLTLPIAKQRAFLVGLFRGDGHLSLRNKVNGTYEAVLALVNEHVIRATWTMLQRAGVPASMTVTKRSEMGNHDVWWCKFNTGSWNGLTRAIWPESPPMVGVVEQIHPFYRMLKDGTIFYRLKSKTEIHLKENVYNLEVEEDHSYVVHGVVAHNCFFDDSEGIWTYVALHNPDNLEVVDAPFIKMEPLMEFVPDDKLRQILTSTDPELQKVKSQLPAELLAKLYSRQNIRLSDTNATFIPRKLHHYETRGTSILSRMWRIFMYEDAIFNASIATARRHAGPLKVAKLGNPQTNWIPGPDQERRFAELVAQAEIDPHAWIIYHYGLSLEAFGTTDRVMTINKEWEIIERIKLAALGLSRSFLTGELTFASATAGLQVFLRRLLSMRNFFTSTWIKPKFFKPVAIMNNFIKPTQAELSNRIRVRRTAENLIRDKRLIIPQLDWANKLNPMVDNDLIKAYESLEKMGFRISKTKKGAAVNLGYEEEVRRCIEEDKFEDAVREEHGLPKEKGDPEEIKQVIDKTDESNPDKGKPPAGTPPPNPRMPPPSPAAPPEEPKKDDKKGEVEETSDDEELAQPAKPGPGPEGWSDGEVSGLIELLAQGTTDQAFWAQLIPRRVKKLETDPQTHTQHHVEVLEGPDPHRHMRRGDPDRAWDEIEMFLDDQGYPAKDVAGLRTYLVRHDVLAPSALERFEASLPADTTVLSDKQMNDLFDTAVATSLRSRKMR